MNVNGYVPTMKIFPFISVLDQLPDISGLTSKTVCDKTGQDVRCKNIILVETNLWGMNLLNNFLLNMMH